MSRGQGLDRIHLYVAAVGVVATGVLAVCVATIDLGGIRTWGVAALAFWGLFVVAEFFPVRMLGRVDSGEFTASGTFAYALLLIAPLPVALLALAAGIAIGEHRPRHRKPLVRVVFNVSQLTVAFAAGGGILALAGGLGPTTAQIPPAVLLALLPSGLLMYGVNVVLTSLAIAVDQGAPLRTVLERDFAPFDMLTHLLLFAFAPVFVIVWHHSFLLVPLLLAAVVGTYRSTHAAIASKHDSRHDSLTSLPNRRLLDERLTELVGGPGDPDRFSVMLMDLDRFKQVNDALGHQLGDQLLVAVARRLRVLSGIDTIARVGGDEFAFVVRGARSSAQLRELAQSIIDAVTTPYSIQAVPLQVGASIGIATFPEHGTDVASLLRRADSAMYGAKGTQERVRLALTTDERRSPGRLSLVGELEAALEAGQLRLDYQPQLELASNRVVSLEALLRWDHPRHGQVQPDRFVQTVEYTELLPTLTRYVVERALLDRAARTVDGRSLPISVNISARDLLDRRLPRDIAARLAAHDTSPSHLTLEVTENALLADPEQAVQVIGDLVEAGVGLSIDDFGTGYSSLATLRDLPVTELKIERSFVAGMRGSRAGHRVVRAVIELAQDLDLRVVAEGIEHPAELGELQRLGCDVGQGFLLCRPLPSNELAAWLRGRSPTGEAGRVGDDAAVTATEPVSPARLTGYDRR